MGRGELEEHWGLRRRDARKIYNGRVEVKRKLGLFLLSGLVAAAGLAVSGRPDAALTVSAITAVSFLVSMLLARRWARWAS